MRFATALHDYNKRHRGVPSRLSQGRGEMPDGPVPTPDSSKIQCSDILQVVATLAEYRAAAAPLVYNIQRGALGPAAYEISGVCRFRYPPRTWIAIAVTQRGVQEIDVDRNLSLSL